MTSDMASAMAWASRFTRGRDCPAPDAPLVEGNAVTVEPGVYLPGVLGVRIEDLVVVCSEAPEVLTGLSKELTIIG
jgi:Xaa-Pro aminopeptidase